MSFQWYEKNFLWWELLLSIIFALAFLAVMKCGSIEPKLIELLNDSRNPLYTSIASIAGAILGFVIAGFSIIYALLDHDELERVKESSHAKDIQKTYMSAIRALALTTFLAMLAILFDKDSNPCVVMFYLNIFGVTLSSFRVWRCIWILENLVEIFTSK